MSKSVYYKNYLEYNANAVVESLVKELHDSHEASRLYEKILKREQECDDPSEDLIESCKSLIENYKKTEAVLTVSLINAGVSPFDTN